MFTGLVEEMGEIANISRKDTSLRITIKGNSGSWSGVVKYTFL